MGPKFDHVIDIGPDLGPPGTFQGDPLKESHRLEVEKQGGSKIGLSKENKTLAQRKGRIETAGESGCVGKGKQKKRVWARKVRSNDLGDKVVEAIPEKPLFKRKIGGIAKTDDEHGYRQKNP